MTPNPNTNCLAMMRCPACGSFGPFRIATTIFVLVTDEGTEDTGGDYEWEKGSACICRECDHDGTVGTFTDPVPAKSDTFRTDDGYTLRWSNENLAWFTGKSWEERDMQFLANGDGLPVDHNGEPLDGCYIEEE